MSGCDCTKTSTCTTQHAGDCACDCHRVRREVEVDTALAHLWSEREGLYRSLDSTRQTIARLSGAERSRTGRYTHYLGTHADWTTALRERLTDLPPWDTRTAKMSLERQDELVAQVADLNTKIAPLDAEYNAAPWSRFFLVQNHGGHIHSSMHCSTCRPTTSFGWLPNLSGLTEKDAVEAHGPLLCTVCYPSAPVEWTMGPTAVVDPNECPGSGTHEHDSSGLHYYQRRAVCNHCHRTTSVTSTGKMRKHKKAA